MKKALLTLMCLAAMMVASTNVKAQEVTIVLMPGYTWISIPSTDTLNFATALGSFTPMAGDVIKSQWGNAFYRNGQWYGNITQFFPGYGYHYYSNRNVPVMLTFNVQQPAPQVVVTTSEPLLITAISAMGGGEVIVSDGTYIIVKGLCWATHENPTTNDDFFEEAESGVGSFSLSMTGLNISTTYYVRAYAVTPNGTVYGDQKTFTTRDGIPTLTTDSVMDITGATATCGGDITDNGGLNVTARGVCWSTSPNPTVADSHTTNGNGNGSFSSSITGLSVSTTYYVRAYATTAAGTGYGDEKTFTTRDGIPTLTTAEVTNITGITASSGGNITDNGGLNVTARGVCWSTSQNPTVSDSHTTNGSGNGSFSSSITGLSLSTTYYVRAYATTAAGTAYGDQKTFTTRDGIPTVTTTEVSNIGPTWAYSGGTIADDGGGLTITAKGVCWSISPYPTLADSHTNDGNGTNNFTSHITGLSLNTTYYVRAYVTNSLVTVYGNQFSFTTLEDYVYVDLGLPSGLLWATCNVGANAPEDYGDYFAWGETQPKDAYNWSTYQYCMGSYNTLTKYCNISSYGYNGFTDNLTTLFLEDDVAATNWGVEWRMPNYNEWVELYQNTTCTWITQNGVNGRLFTSSNGSSLFLPAAGYLDGNNLWSFGNWGVYGSCLLSEWPGSAWNFFFGSGSGNNYGMDDTFDRSNGLSVRPVRCKSSIINITVNPTEGGEVNGGGTYQDHTSCTVSAVANEGYNFANWTENGEVVSTEATYTFTVCGNRNLVANFVCLYVDLGLPSGTLWAICNVGSNDSWGSGTRFAWGETEPKSNFSWSNYQYCNGSSTTLIKYCNNANYGYNGFTDDLTILLPEDDAATVNLGGDWRMPTHTEWQELFQNTTAHWYSNDEAFGFLCTASNGNSIFFPAVPYWSSSLRTNQPNTAFLRDLDEEGWRDYDDRYMGYYVRAVRSVPQFSIDATANPAEGGEVRGAGTYSQGAECTLAAMPNEGFIVSNWTEGGVVVSTDATYTFSVDADRTLVVNFTYDGSHSYVDLGLPSGTLWAISNVGADAPEDYGNYFAWGETELKNIYNWSTYQYCIGNSSMLTKYCDNSSYGYNGFTDNLTTLLPDDDVATVNWGADWRMPTMEEWQELYQNTTHSLAIQNGVNGRLFTATNGNTLFLPAAGYRYENNLYGAGEYCYYWSSSLSTNYFPYCAWFFNGGGMVHMQRQDGSSVRAVRSSRQN